MTAATRTEIDLLVVGSGAAGSVLAARLTVGQEQPPLEARRHDPDPGLREQIAQPLRLRGGEEAFGVAEPEIDGAAVAGGVIVEDRGEVGVERADRAERRDRRRNRRTVA